MVIAFYGDQNYDLVLVVSFYNYSTFNFQIPQLTPRKFSHLFKTFSSQLHRRRCPQARALRQLPVQLLRRLSQRVNPQSPQRPDHLQVRRSGSHSKLVLVTSMLSELPASPSRFIRCLMNPSTLLELPTSPSRFFPSPVFRILLQQRL